MNLNPTYTFKLGDIDESFEELWVILRKSNHIPYADFQRLWGPPSDEESDPETFSLSRMAYHIADWNLTEEDGGTLPLPSHSEDPVEAMRKLPASIVSTIGFRIIEEFRESNAALGEVVRSFSTGSQDFTDSTSSQESQEPTTAE